MATSEEIDKKIKDLEDKQAKLEDDIQVYGKARAGMDYKSRMREKLDKEWADRQARKKMNRNGGLYSELIRKHGKAS